MLHKGTLFSEIFQGHLSEGEAASPMMKELGAAANETKSLSVTEEMVDHIKDSKQSTEASEAPPTANGQFQYGQ